MAIPHLGALVLGAAVMVLPSPAAAAARPLPTPAATPAAGLGRTPVPSPGASRTPALAALPAAPSGTLHADLAALPRDGARARQAYVASRFAALGLAPLDGLPDRGWLQQFEAAETRIDPNTALVLARKSGRTNIAIRPVAGSDEGEIPFTVAVWVGAGTSVASYGPEVRGALAVAAVAAPADLAQEAAEMRARVGAAREAGALALVIARPDAADPDWSELASYPSTPSRRGTRGSDVDRFTGSSEPLGLPVVIAGSALLGALAERGDVAALLARPAPAVRPLEGVLRVQFQRKSHAAANVLAYLPGADRRFRDELVVIGARLDGPGVAGLIEVARAFVSGERHSARSLLFAAFGAGDWGLAGARAVAELPARVTVMAELSTDTARGGPAAVGAVRLLGAELSPALAELAVQLAPVAGVELVHDGLRALPGPISGWTSFRERDIPALGIRSSDDGETLARAADLVAALVEQLSVTPSAGLTRPADLQATAPASASPPPAADAAAATAPTRRPVPGDPLRDQRELHLRNVRQLTFGGENAEAYWSMDGKQLILQSTRPPFPCDQIFILTLDSGENRLVSTGKGRTTCSYFFPDGQRILYSSTHMAGDGCPPKPDFSQGYVWSLDDFDVFTAAPDGSELRRITWNPRYDAEATISEDGKRVVFTSLRDGDLEIYTMNPDGGDALRLTRTPGYDGGAFFSPDGKKIVYRAHHPTNPEELARYQGLIARNLVEPRALEIMVMNTDGSNQHPITSNQAANFGPYWTRDGKQIIFASNMADPRGRNFDLYLVGAGGGKLERLTFDDTFDGFPMFSPDGRSLVWASNRNSAIRGETNIFLADWLE